MLHTNDLSPLPSESAADLVLWRLLRRGEGEWGRSMQKEKQWSVPSCFWKAEQFHRTAPHCYFKGRDKGLPRRNCTWTCCAEKQRKAYNLRSTLIVLKAFSGIRNTKFSAWLALCVLALEFAFFCFFPVPTLICSFNIFWLHARSDIFVYPKRQTIMLINFSLCPPCEFRCDVPKFGMPRQR